MSNDANIIHVHGDQRAKHMTALIFDIWRRAIIHRRFAGINSILIISDSSSALPSR